MSAATLFLPCAAGVEALLAEEVARHLPGSAPAARRGGVEVAGGAREAMVLNLHSRLAQRVLWPVAGGAAGGMAAGEYSEGDMKPRQVIGLNDAVDPGATYIVAFSESDDLVKERAPLVTGQLDFKPNETLVLRRLGGEMALNCRAQAWSYVTNFPPVPFIRDPDPDPPPPPPPDLASPN